MITLIGFVVLEKKSLEVAGYTFNIGKKWEISYKIDFFK